MFLTEIEQLNTMLQKKEQSQQQNQAFQQNIRLKTSASKKIYSFGW